MNVLVVIANNSLINVLCNITMKNVSVAKLKNAKMTNSSGILYNVNANVIPKNVGQDMYGTLIFVNVYIVMK